MVVTAWGKSTSRNAPSTSLQVNLIGQPHLACPKQRRRRSPVPTSRACLILGTSPPRRIRQSLCRICWRPSNGSRRRGNHEAPWPHARVEGISPSKVVGRIVLLPSRSSRCVVVFLVRRRALLLTCVIQASENIASEIVHHCIHAWRMICLYGWFNT